MKYVVFLSIAFAVAFSCTLQAQERPTPSDPYASDRERMVEVIQKPIFGRTPIRDERVLNAMRKVLRHAFVPERYRIEAYADSPLPIGNGQTISQPYIVARMTQAAKIKATDRVLEIGTGSGYQAAVLAELAKEVYTIEIVEELGVRARKALESLGYNNIHFKIGDGYKGWPDAAPFDAIIVTAAPDHIPQPLLDQLKPGGRLLIPVGPVSRVQQLKLITKDADGALHEKSLDDVRFVPLVRDEQK